MVDFRRGFPWLAVPLILLFGVAKVRTAPERLTFQEKRANFHTRLLRHGPSPQKYRDEKPPQGIDLVHYPSAGRSLKAWLYRPPVDPAQADRKRPVLVYFHGNYAFSSHDMAVCMPFIQAGFIVMTPMLRGENGNPGYFEMYMGEVDDACAAVQWIAAQDGVDSRQIYTFGHSAGGVISALLSLMPDIPVKITGSSGGLYGWHLFHLDKATPFDTSNPLEGQLRTLIGNVRDMKRKHIAYVGRDDGFQEARAAWEEEPWRSKLTIHVLPGGHFSVLNSSIQSYLEDVKSDLGRRWKP